MEGHWDVARLDYSWVLRYRVKTGLGLFKHGVSLNLIKLVQGICLGFDVHSLMTSSMSSVEGLLCKKCLPDKFTFINAIHQATSEADEKDVVQKWFLNQISVTLKSYVSPDLSNIPFLVSRACKKGIQGIYQMYICCLLKSRVPWHSHSDPSKRLFLIKHSSF